MQTKYPPLVLNFSQQEPMNQKPQICLNSQMHLKNLSRPRTILHYIALYYIDLILNSLDVTNVSK